MDKPIIFNTSMVQALLAGRKTQTRRIVKAKSHVDGVTNKQSTIVAKKFQHAAKAGRWYGYDDYDITCYADSPYGKPGDLLWVRESFNWDWGNFLIYKADDPTGHGARDAGYDREPKYKPSIHMRREDSRLTLLIKDIRIERVQEITEKDAKAEGVERTDWKYSCEPYRNYNEPKMSSGKNCSLAKTSFSTLWNSINEQRGYGWDLNPWVWVVEFKVFQQNIGQVSKTKKGIDLIKNLELVP